MWLQLKSANKYSRMDTVHEWLLITPAAHADQLAVWLEDALSILPDGYVNYVTFTHK